MALLTTAERNLLTVKRPQLLKDLIISEHLYAIMLADNSFTDSMVEEIKQAGTRSSQIALLLDLLGRRSQKALRTFIEALVTTHQEHLAGLLNTNLASKLVEERDRSSGVKVSPSQPTPDPPSGSAAILQPTVPKRPISPGNTINSPTFPSSASTVPSDENSAGTSHPVGRQDSLVAQPYEDHEPAEKSVCPMDVENSSDVDQVILRKLENLEIDKLRIDSSLEQSYIDNEPDCCVKHGFAFIINNMGKEVEDEEHIAITYAAIQVFFDKMNFKTTVPLSNVGLNGLRDEIRRNHKRISSSDAFVVYFMGRGNSLETIFMSSSEVVSIFNDFMALFNEISLPILRNKPKLFVFHIAQLESSDSGRMAVDSVDANVNDSFWNDMIVFRTLSVVTFEGPEMAKSLNKFVVPFYAFHMVASKFMGVLSAYDVLLKVRKLISQLKLNPSNGIVNFALSQTPHTDGVKPLSFFETGISF